MPIRPPEFDEVAQHFAPLLRGLPPKLVAVDGRAGSGKSTLGRFLAWYFNSTLIELDLYLVEGGLVHRVEEIKHLIDRRLGLRRPVFVEGLLVLQILEAIERKPDHLIYVRNSKWSRGLGFGPELDAYDARYHSAENADYLMELEHDG